MDVIITSNSPGELSAWVAPVAALWRKKHPQWNIYVALVPCPFASGHEIDVARRIEGVKEVWPPKRTLRVMLGGRLPIPKSERGLVVYLGGSALHAWLLGRRWGYPCVAYASHYSSVLTRFTRVAAQTESLAQRLAAEGVNSRCVGFAGWPVPAAERKNGGPLCIGLFPGSRLFMLRYTLGPFLEVAKRLGERMPGTRFILSVSPFVEREELQDILDHPGDFGVERGTGILGGDELRIDGGPVLEVYWGQSRQVIERIDAAISIPGTNTGEIAAAGRALIVGLSSSIPIPRGGLGWLIEHIPGFKSFQQRQHLRYYKRRRFASLPNMISGGMAAPEIIVNDDLNVVVDLAAEIFGDEKKRLELGQRLAAIMGDPGAAAEKLADFLAGGAESGCGDGK